MSKLYNLARMTTGTVGTGTITLGSALSSFLTFAQAGIQNGDAITYGIADGNNREIGRGVYTSAGTTLTRSELNSTHSNAPIRLSGAAEVFITPTAEDFGILRGYIDGCSLLYATSNTLTVKAAQCTSDDKPTM